MTTGETPSVAMVFDLSPKGIYTPVVREVIDQMEGWRARDYTNEEYALKNMDENTRALIAVPNGPIRDNFKGEELLGQAQELSIPRAIITPRTISVRSSIRLTDKDMVLTPSIGPKIPGRLLYWLRRLDETQQP